MDGLKLAANVKGLYQASFSKETLDRKDHLYGGWVSSSFFQFLIPSKFEYNVPDLMTKSRANYRHVLEIRQDTKVIKNTRAVTQLNAFLGSIAGLMGLFMGWGSRVFGGIVYFRA